MKSVKTKARFMKMPITYSLLVLLISSFLTGSMPLDDFSMVYYAFDDTTISNKIIYKENTPESNCCVFKRGDV